MSRRLPRVTSSELLRVAKKLGFKLDRQTGSHAIFYKQETKQRAVIPIHKKKIIKPKTLLAILEDMGITTQEFRKLM